MTNVVTCSNLLALWRTNFNMKLNREKFDFLMEKAHERTSNGQRANQNSSGFNQSEHTEYSGRFELDIIQNTQIQAFQVDEMISDGAQGRIFNFRLLNYFENA